MKFGLLVEILLLFLVSWISILSYQQALPSRGNFSEPLAILLLAMVTSWIIFVLRKKRWLVLMALFFNQTRQRLLNSNRRHDLIKTLLLALLDLGIIILMFLTVVRAAYRCLYPSLMYNRNWYDSVLNFAAVITGAIMFPVLANWLYVQITISTKKRKVTF